MTRRLSDTSPRFAAAVKFGELLTRTMAKRQVGQHVVKDAARVSRSAIVEWRNGRNLPTLEVALRVSEALNEPELAAIVRRGRTIECRRCGRPFVNEAGFPKRYCSAACRVLGQPAEMKRRSDAEQAVMILRGELLRVGPAKKQQIGRALTLLDDFHRPEKEALEAVHAYQDSVVAMCASCEPEGLCRTPECPLRAVSPLPLALGDRDVDVAVKPAGLWGTPGMREHMAEVMRRRHADPADPIQRGTAALRDPDVRRRAAESSIAASRARSFEDRSAASKRAWATRRAAIA